MLIIGRRLGESIFLGPDIELRVVDLTPSRVTLGIVAPRQLPVLRGELKQAAERNRAASRVESAEALARLISAFHSSHSGNSRR